ncbi:hypothetical protein N0V88_004057 [Collariella sp. IMI 366227]|nr:hypothetical protein N0V88_004057 [Collariella sp. IMI 366227]
MASPIGYLIHHDPPPPPPPPRSETPALGFPSDTTPLIYPPAEPRAPLRHIAAHTLGKRFTCDICSKAFARADLLKRHRANHLDEHGTKRRRFSSAPSAGRVGQACQACAKARVKCEEVKP